MVTTSDWALVSKISGGIVLGGMSTALRAGKSANCFMYNGRLLFSPKVRTFRVPSYLHVYLLARVQ